MKALAQFAALFLALGCAALLAQAPAPPDQRLREQLRTITTQLRNAEAERATLQAEKGALEKKVEDLEKDKKKLIDDVLEEQKKAKAEAEKLSGEMVTLKAEHEATKNLLVKADAFGKQSAELARKTEAERSRLAGENLHLKRVVADQRVKNAKMHELASEILSRYEKFGLGTAITAREPFVGITRARLEALAEDYRGKIAAERIRLDGTSPKPAESAAAPQSQDAGTNPKKRASKP